MRFIKLIKQIKKLQNPRGLEAKYISKYGSWFSADKIDRNLLHQIDNITLYGIWIVDSSSQYLEAFDKVCSIIQKILKNNAGNSVKKQNIYYYEIIVNSNDLSDKDIDDFYYFSSLFLRIGFNVKDDGKFLELDDHPSFLRLLEYNGLQDLINKTFKIYSEKEITKNKKTAEETKDIDELTHLESKVHSDKWAIEDKLDYELFATSITSFIKDEQSKPPLTFAIIAPWGFGKTTLMNFIKRNLDGKENEKNATNDTATTFEKLIEWTENKPKEENRKLEYPTVWFNPWKYQETKQVYAGLAYNIITQLVGKLDIYEREKFWFNLQLKRFNTTKIRADIYKFVFNKVLPFITAGLIVFFIGMALIISNYLEGGITLVVISLLLGAGPFSISYFKTIKDKVSGDFNQYIDQPTYEESLGSFHYMEEDLEKVFDLLVKKPAVVFIDDLDRCSPKRIVDVMEAINLIINSKFSDKCYFVVGIDSQMVAAALECSYGEYKIPLKAQEYKHGSVGWYFLEKFIQLPFHLPTLNKESGNKLLDYLFDKKERVSLNNIADNDSDLNKIQSPPIEQSVFEQTFSDNAQTQKEAEEKIQQSLKESNYDPEKVKEVSKKVVEAGMKEVKIDAPEVLEQISKYTEYINDPPRSIKRFSNLLRFYYVHLKAKQLTTGNKITHSVISKWIIIMLKWPQLVRWIQWENHKGIIDSYSAKEKANKIDTLMQDCKEYEDWDTNFKDLPELCILRDKQLFNLLKDHNDEEMSLGKAIDCGVW